MSVQFLAMIFNNWFYYFQSHDINEPEQQRKLFIGGLSFDTTSDGLRDYFNKFGEVIGKQLYFRYC